MPTVNYSISVTSNDVTYSVAFGGLLDSNVLAGDGSTVGYGTLTAGLRFLAVAVPQGATITAATLTLTATGRGGSTNYGTIKGVAADTAPAWSGSNPTTVPRTTASTTLQAADSGALVHSVAAQVQEIVSRAGWVSGNALALVLDPTGATGFAGYVDYNDNPAQTAALSITYATGGGISGSAAITEAGDTITSTGQTALKAALARTEASDTVASISRIALRAALARTEASDTISAAGTVSSAIAGAAAITEASDGVVATATLPIVAASALTEASDSSASTGSLATSGILASSEAVDTLAGASALALRAAANPTEADDTAAAAAILSIRAALGVTEAGDVLVSGSSNTTSTDGSVSLLVEEDDLVNAVGRLSIAAALVGTEGSDNCLATGALAISGVVAANDNDDSLSASASMSIVGAVFAAEDGDALSAVAMNRVALPVPASRAASSSVELRSAASTPQPSRAAETAVIRSRVAS